MALVDIRVPQLGEGLQEALVVTLLKSPGTRVDKDEPVFEMETDKARVAVEAACTGLLREWLVSEGDVVAIGSVIGRIESADAGEPETARGGQGAPAPGASAGARRGARTEPAGASVRIPPRTRAQARRLGLSEEELRRIPAPSGKLLPEDVDRYVVERARTPAEDAGDAYREHRLSTQQRALTFRFRRSAQLVIPATITCPLAWSGVERALEAARAAHPDAAIGTLEVIAYAVARGAGARPNFRSVLLGDDRVREYSHVTLGIAVHRPDGELVTAAVPRADTMALPEVARAVQSTVASAMEGRDQTDETTQVVLTYLGGSTVIHGVPALVAPAVATLFVGAPTDFGAGGMARAAALCLTFDHRLINGVEAAQFLEAVTAEVDRLAASSGTVQAEVTCASASRSVAWEAADVRDRAPTGERVARAEALLRDRVVSLLGRPLGASDFRRPLRSLGLTSVMSVALSKGLERDLGVPVPATLVWNFPTVEAITRYLANQLDARAEPASVPDDSAGEEEGFERLLEEVEGLSDAEVSRLLSEEEKRRGPRND